MQGYRWKCQLALTNLYYDGLFSLAKSLKNNNFFQKIEYQSEVV